MPTGPFWGNSTAGLGRQQGFGYKPRVNYTPFYVQQGKLATKWVGPNSMRSFSRAGRTLGQAISGSYTAPNWAPMGFMTPQGPLANKRYSTGTMQRKITGKNRARLAGAGVANMGRGIKRLPMRTKIAAPLAIGGAYFWMRRNKKDQFYTHYFDY